MGLGREADSEDAISKSCSVFMLVTSSVVCPDVGVDEHLQDCTPRHVEHAPALFFPELMFSYLLPSSQ